MRPRPAASLAGGGGGGALRVPADRPRRSIVVLNERDLENPLAGGAEVHVFEIFRRLTARGHRVRVLAASFPGAAPVTDHHGVTIRRLVTRYAYYARVPFALRRALAEEPTDVVVDVLNKFPFFTPWVAAVPCAAIVHHLFGRTAFRQVAMPIALATFAAEKLIPFAHRTTPMLAISASTRDDLVARGIAAEHIVVVPPGLDRAAYVPGPAGPRAPLILWIGRLEPYKRADVLIDAMPEILRQVPAARLAIVGAGHARVALEERVRRRGVGHAVEFTGFVPEERKIDYLRRAAVLVNTSEKEGFGLTVIEANACGTPNVSTDVAGLRDSVRDGETGLLVPFGEAPALARAVLRVLTDPGLRDRMVAQGLEWSARFSWDRAADGMETTIERAIARRQRPETAPAAVAAPERPPGAA
jgi:glycosyltransferase involved in cell wall biosynthesis